MTPNATRNLVLSFLVPPLGILLMVVGLRAAGIYNLGPVLDPLAQLTIIAVGFNFFRRANPANVLFTGLIYFPVMVVVSWGLALLVTGSLRWYEY